MDLFNTKKLVEKEGKLKELEYQNQQLKSDNQKQQEELSELKATVEKLHQEMKKNQQLHDDVVDTMIGEIQDFMVDNHEKNLKFKTLDSLFPLIKEHIHSNYLTVRLDIYVPSFLQRNENLHHKLLISLARKYCYGWVGEGILERGVVQDLYVNKDEFTKETILSTFSKHSIDDVIFMLKSLQSDVYDLSVEKAIIKPKRFIFEKNSEESISINIIYNEIGYKSKGF